MFTFLATMESDSRVMHTAVRYQKYVYISSTQNNKTNKNTYYKTSICLTFYYRSSVVHFFKRLVKNQYKSVQSVQETPPTLTNSARTTPPIIMQRKMSNVWLPQAHPLNTEWIQRYPPTVPMPVLHAGMYLENGRMFLARFLEKVCRPWRSQVIKNTAHH